MVHIVAQGLETEAQEHLKYLRLAVADCLERGDIVIGYPNAFTRIKTHAGAG